MWLQGLSGWDCTVLAGVAGQPSSVSISDKTHSTSSASAASSATALRAQMAASACRGFSACHRRLDSTIQATDPLDALDGGPGGSVGSESDGAGPPASLASASGSV